MCEVLAVPRSSYYGSLEKTTSKRELENQELTQEIQRIHLESKSRYCAPKIHKTLSNNGVCLSLKRVQRLMRKAGIRSITRKKYRPFPSKEKVVQLGNLLKRDFVARVQAHIKRFKLLTGMGNSQEIIEKKNILVDKGARKVFILGQEFIFPTREFDLLVFFMEHPNRVWTKELYLHDQ
ncbi:IS3 family transposase [Niallia taxi]